MESVKNLHRARKTVIEMIADRGYEISEEQIPFSEFSGLYHTGKIDIHVVNKDKEVYVKFLTAYKTKPNSIRDMITEIKDEIFTKLHNNLIIVTLTKPNNTILKIKNEYTNIEFFWLNRLIINITQHQYVPKHELISKEEIPGIIKKFNLADIHQLPLIDRNDPVCRYYNFKSGNICKITRMDKISGISIIYRLVK